MAATKIDFAELKDMARGRWPEILTSIGGLPAESLDGKHGPCPKCGGTDRFRLVDAEAGAVLCNQCFAKHNGDGFSAIQWLRCWTFIEASKAVAEFLGVELAKPKRVKKAKPADGQEGEGAVYATARDAVRAAIRACTPADLSIGPAVFNRIDQYDTFAVLRVNLPTPAGEKQRKTFRPLHSFPLADGRLAWKFGYPETNGHLRPLYRLKEIQAAADASLVVVVAGEKAAAAAAEIGLVATTNAGGEKAVALTDWGPVLRFARVVVSTDNDPAGRLYGVLVAEQLRKLKPSVDVAVVELPDLPEKGDIVEWIAAGGTREKFMELAGQAKAAKPDAYAAEKAICEDLKIDVLGELPEGLIRVFSGHHGKTIDLNATKASYVDMLRMFGQPAKEKITKSREQIPGMHTVDRVREAIGYLGGQEKAGQGFEKGLGAWQGDDGQIVLVGPGRAAVWDGAALTVHKRPRVAGIKVDLDHPKEASWFSEETLSRYLSESADKKWCIDCLDRCSSIFSQWNWRQPDESRPQTSSEILSGLILASWVQSVWSWRPMVGIAAGSDSGKTTLFEVLEAIFGPLALLNSKSTEAGLRQAVGHHSKVIMCDEFESDRHRQGILEFFRTSSKGSRTLRGTTGQGGKQYGLQHICWVTAVELGLKRAPDRNRFIMLELAPPPAARRGKLSLPLPDDLRDLGQRLLAIAVRYAVEAEEIAGRLKLVRVEGVHGRVIESVSTPVGMLAAVLGLDEPGQQGLMRAVVDGLDNDPAQSTKDETDLLGDILGSTVSLGRGDVASVAQIIAKPADYTTGWKALERVGIAISGPVKVNSRSVYEDREKWEGLFIAHKSVLRFLLRGTDWEGQSIDSILRRIPGARKCQRMMGGHRPWGVTIPWGLIRDKYVGCEDGQDDFK